MQIGDISIEVLAMGALQTNCIVIATSSGEIGGIGGIGGSCCVVDPVEPLGELLELIEQEKLTVSDIIVTHGHGDHISGVSELWQSYPKARFIAPADDEFMLADSMANLSAPFGMPTTAPPPSETISPGDEITLAGHKWHVLDSSGHTPGGLTFHCPELRLAICGDALFCGSIGRCDLPGSDMERLLGNIRDNLLTLPPETVMIPGHGPATTAGAEKKSNPFLK